MDNM
jgi:hypothetical protein